MQLHSVNENVHEILKNTISESLGAVLSVKDVTESTYYELLKGIWM